MGTGDHIGGRGGTSLPSTVTESCCLRAPMLKVEESEMGHFYRQGDCCVWGAQSLGQAGLPAA